jgi:O-antigen/teichoic acid export membrane protein
MASLKKNYIYNLAYQIITLLMPFITTPYTSRVLGADCIGINSFTGSILNYFTLFGTLGIALYGQREIAFNQNNKIEKTRIFWNLFILRLFTVSISLIAYLIIVVSWKKYQTIFLIQTINIIACLFDVTWFCQGEENFKIVVVRNLFFRVLSVFLLFTLIKTSSDLWKFVLMNSGLALLCNASLFPYVLHRIERIPIKMMSPLKQLVPVFVLFVPQIAVEIYTVLDKSMIGFITNSPYENGCYEQANKMVKMLLVVVTSLGTVVVPRMATLHAQGNTKTIQQYMLRSFSFVFLVAFPMCIGLSCIASVFVPIFFGNGYDTVVPLLKIFSLLFIVIGLNNVIGIQYLIPIKKEHVFTYTVVAGAVCNFVLNLFLIRKFGATGAAIASVAAEAVITLLQFIYIRKIIDIKGLFFQSWKYGLAAITMGIVVLLLKRVVNRSIISLLLLFIAGSSVYIILLIMTRDAFAKQMFEKLLKRRLSHEKYE